ncbi:hypothetical protein M409DRAFT_64946 [Zasmidium cellare ATCC 36951]|uniref:Ribosomal protein S15 n=1 Tax=Zasmidium cellare ATCC 36951 TaxID=1080233 RepID=A0A6A6CSR5_ZASCE|nr:uncharacterized protein M409DRAFT_64946 [Zasmidium cellare ATCC 36951]KAF2169200.1 hypothetical protein M409DRAFT_64946 [Zasmidium cellare ATCC 36951]
MPPRIPVLQCLRPQSTSSASCTSRAFATTPSSRASTVTQRRKHRDPYAIAQAKARKAANMSRQEVLKKERAAVLGDPVRGETTPFVRSFDTALPPEPSPAAAATKGRTDESPSEDAPGPRVDSDNHLNFFLSKDELEGNVQRSKWLTQPLPEDVKEEADQQQRLEERGERDSFSDRKSSSGLSAQHQAEIHSLLSGMEDSSAQEPRDSWFDSARRISDFTSTHASREERLKEEHETAEEALKRISSLSLGNSKDRIRVNIQRCVDVFGRHNTDSTLPPRPRSADTIQEQDKFPRVGKDTGSSEVQIAILTAKIRTLADTLELRGHPDKMNKRNLRLLVHRRAKLLNYLRRKERGGPRWQHLIEKLGLTEGTWKGEISL